ncbi:MAG: hypothetical protein AAF557_23755 [Pseudomonadota bacterium]
MRLFDTIVIVDWSARSKPSPVRPTKDAIWWAIAGSDLVKNPAYHRTRHAALDALVETLRADLTVGHRVLVGFDFPFGYPAGTAGVLTGRDDALALWAWLADHIEDASDNGNNRFTVAQEINDHFPGIGPFWGRPETWDFPRIPTHGRDRNGAGHPAERRIVERHQTNAQPVWKLYTTGSVGSQVLLGLPALQRLRLTPDLADHIQVWPFQTGLNVPTAPIVLAEIYPSLLASLVKERQRDGEITDAAQVRVNAAAFSALDRDERLGPLFAGPPDLTPEERRTIEQEEAWILGTGFREQLEAAA